MCLYLENHHIIADYGYFYFYIENNNNDRIAVIKYIVYMIEMHVICTAYAYESRKSMQPMNHH